MIIPPELQNRYDNVAPYLSVLEKRVKEIVFRFCEKESFAFVARLKDVGSLSEKVDSGRYTRWSDLDDLYACSVIIPSLSYEGRVLRFLTNEFQTISIKKRGQAFKPPDSFRFDSTRYIGRLKKIDGTELPDPLYSLSFEVQIRSAFEHAWSVSTHDLAYKHETVDWRRLRIAAQLKAAVEQLDGMILTFDHAITGMIESRWPALYAKTLLVNGFKRLVDDKVIPQEFIPRDWSRFGENLYSLLLTAQKEDEKSPELVGRAMTIVESKLKQVPADRFPRSISLMQIVFAVLNEEDFIHPPLENFIPNITKELETLYPAVRNYSEFFNYEQ